MKLIYFLTIIVCIILFVPIKITIELDKIGYTISLKSKRIYKHTFNKTEKSSKYSKKIRKKRKNIMKLLSGLSIKELDCSIGYHNDDFELMFFIQSSLYIIFPTLSSTLNYYNIKHSLKIINEPIENFKIKCIFSIKMSKIILYLIKERLK